MRGAAATALIVAQVVVFAGCKTEERRLRKIAEALCMNDRGGSQPLGFLSPDLQASVRPADLSGAPSSQEDEKGDGGLAAPGTDLVTGCKATSAEITERGATIRLDRTTRDGRTAPYAIHFDKQGEKWLADYQIPEHAAAKAAELAKFKELRKQAADLADNFDIEGAQAKLAEAKKIRPDDPQLKKDIEAANDLLSKRVAGRWFKLVAKNAMTDKQDAMVMLPSSDLVIGPGRKSRPMLKLRCLEGELTVLLDADQVLEGSIFAGTEVRFRFDQEPAQTETSTRSTDAKALFLSQPKRWIDRLLSHSSGKLTVEVPLFQHGHQPVSFALAGVEEAAKVVRSACQK